MRRIAVISLALTALAAPAVAGAAKSSPDDGVLVVKGGQAPFFFPQVPLAKSTPVVSLKITGSVIGQVGDNGAIVIDPGPNPNGPPPEVTGAGAASSVAKSDTAQQWSSADGFKFRAVGGTFTILIYGAKVNLVAIGTGTVTLAGTPDMKTGDGWYSINGGDHHSLPGQPIKQLIIGDDS
jgi:hypothetical protein